MLIRWLMTRGCSESRRRAPVVAGGGSAASGASATDSRDQNWWGTADTWASWRGGGTGGELWRGHAYTQAGWVEDKKWWSVEDEQPWMAEHWWSRW